VFAQIKDVETPPQVPLEAKKRKLAIDLLLEDDEILEDTGEDPWASKGLTLQLIIKVCEYLVIQHVGNVI
jgi:hypothetical protein